MATTQYIKDPAAVLDYAWDWSSWLADGEAISSRAVTASTGLTKDSDTFTATSVTAWLSGGTAGQDYTVTCQIVTDQSRTDERTITIRCRER